MWRLKSPVLLFRHESIGGTVRFCLLPLVRLFLAALLGKKDSVDVGKDTSRSDGDSAQKTVEFLIVLDGKGDVTRDDTALLVVTGGVSGEFEDLGTEVLKDGGKVDGGSGSHAGGVLSLTKVTSDTSHWELKSCLCRR